MLTLKEQFQNYRSRHWALPAFNIDSFEIYQAVEMAVAETNLPCLVQLSPGEDKFVDANRLLMLVKKANLEGLPIYLNMDHGADVRRLEECLRLGFDMVHFDGSKMDYDTNLSTSAFFVKEMKSKYPQALIELEFNHINLVDDTPAPDSFTKPAQALDFVNKTGADLLAVSIGNLHGVNTLAPERLNISLLSEINHIVADKAFFTLHGGSGVPLTQIQESLALGVVKVNINTDLRLKFIESLRHQLTIQNTEKIYQYLTPAVAEVAQVIKEKLISFTQNV